MSGRWSSSRQAGQYPSIIGNGSTISEEQIRELISMLKRLLPELDARQHSDRGQVSAAKVLWDTCSYIRILHREVDNLCDQLRELLETSDSAEAAAIIRSILSM